MSIKRYNALKDTTITNAFKENLTTRGTDANMGASDSLEVFSIYGQASSGSSELSRVLVQFPIDPIISDRSIGAIPTSGSVNFYMKLSNATHPFTLPKQFTLTVNALSRSWSEGFGLDMESYRNTGVANWISASSTEAWATEGGDFYSSPEFSQYFEEGTEDLEVDITPLVEEWISGAKPNNGVVIRLSSSLEADSRSYYTKKFFARGSEFFYKRPWIEARFDSIIKDDRGRFYLFNPFVPTEKSYNKLYIYNKFKNTFYDIPSVGTGSIYVRLYASVSLPLGSPLPQINGSTVATGSWISTGIYSASVGINTDLTKVYDVWFDTADNVIGYGGELEIVNPDEEERNTGDEYVVSLKNLKKSYKNTDNPKLQVFARNKNWNPNSYTSVVAKAKPTIIDDIYYRVFRVADGLEVIPYGTGSLNHTRLSYDVNGNYFNLDMSLFEPNYTYGIKLTIYDGINYTEAPETFKFKVEA